MVNKIKKELPIELSLATGIVLTGIWFYLTDREIDVIIQILIFTAILWYSLETRLVKKSMVEQNELEKRPIIDLYLRDEPSGNGTKEIFKIRNIGRGVAYNVEIEEIKSGDFSYQFYIQQANSILAPLNDEKPLSMVTTTKANGMIMHDVEDFKREASKKPNQFAAFLITYENIENKKFYSIFKFYNRIPLPKPSEPSIQFIKSDEGNINPKKVHVLCDAEKTRKSVYAVKR